MVISRGDYTGGSALLRDRTINDWRLKLEDLGDSMEAEISDLEDMGAQTELELICDKIRMVLCELESFQQDHAE